ncbi:MAG: helix-turn-helix transcriptional regulator [Bacillota bacterium]|jgi:putative transcriptional regulator|nr:helix-turn-helix transcriptional regulator [Bacillota bacterium]NLL26282.1 helix-turn-helix transcriptional regulator [Erysipelotrichia bacterium]
MRNKLKQLRKEKGLRQEDLADAVDVPRQTIIAIENGRFNPSLELALKICRFLGKAVEEVFFL